MGQSVAKADGLNLEELVKRVESKKGHRDQVYEAAKYYISIGWPVIPVIPGGKSLPGVKSLQRRGINKAITYEDASTNPEKIRMWFHPTEGVFRGWNLGLACGVSVSVIDIDTKEEKDGIKEFIHVFGALPESAPIQRTPTGGLHIVYNHTEGFNTRTNVLPGIDVRGSSRKGKPGSHIVVYPSFRDMDNNATRGVYEWQLGGEPLEPTEQILEVIKVASHNGKVVDLRTGSPLGRGNEEVDESDYYPDAPLEEIQRALNLLDQSISDNYDDWVRIGMAIHSAYPGIDGFDVWHTWSSHSKRYKDEKDCWNHWQSFDSGSEGGVGLGSLFYLARTRGYRKPGEQSSWLSENLRFTDKGTLYPSIHNLDVILRSPEFQQEFGGPLRYEDFTAQVFCGDTLMANSAWVKIQSWLSTKFMFEKAAMTIREVGWSIAEENKSDMLRDYIENLKWDGVDRLEKLARVIDLKDDYERDAVKRWMISAVARGIKPGAKADLMLILVGDQGIGKSRFFQALVPNENWFTDSITSKLAAGSKDEELYKLAGKWIIEMGELVAFRRRGNQGSSTADEIKSFLSTSIDTFRRKYDRDPVNVPRRCVFGGTSNDDTFLTDPTGSRRFIIITVRHIIDIDWVTANRDQLWAQIFSMYHSGEQWWMDDVMTATQTERNEEYYGSHPWHDTIGAWAEDKSRFKVEDVLKFALGRDPNHATGGDAAMVREALRYMKFHRKKTRADGTIHKALYHNPFPEVDERFIGTKWKPDMDTEF